MGEARRLASASDEELFETRLDIHDRKQFELKLEYQPSGTDRQSQYFVETTLFVPRSLNIGPDTWPREAFYADLHNYVRLSTPEFTFEELLSTGLSPLVQLERRMQLGLLGPEAEVLYDAKMLACVVRGTLRRLTQQMQRRASGDSKECSEESLLRFASPQIEGTEAVLKRYRHVMAGLSEKYQLAERTCAALRLVDEYLSLLVEHYFRRCVVLMDSLPRSARSLELRRAFMEVVVADEQYRRAQKLPSVIAPGSDNEEYAHRVGFLKKFCQNILFLKVLRSGSRKAWEEVLFAIAAGSAMAFALGVGLFAQSRYPQASFNFFVMAVVGYMVKDRIKEGLRRLLAAYMGKFLFERTTRIFDPVTRDEVGVCHEKIDYGTAVDVPDDVQRLRQRDDLATVTQGELSESVVRYRKKIVLQSEMLPRIADGIVTGVTDIIRFNVERLLHDMDDPEYALDYVDLDDYSVEKVTMSKSYRIDLALRFSVDDGKHQRTTLRLVRLVMDRNGIKRLTELVPETVVSAVVKPHPAPPVAATHEGRHRSPFSAGLVEPRPP